MKAIQPLLAGLLLLLFASCTPSPGEPTATTAPASPTTETSPTQPAAQGSLSGFAWQDQNLDNQVDENEKLPEVTITLAAGDECRTELATTTTSSDGSFTFTGLSAGRYCLTGTDGEVTVSQAGLLLGGEQHLSGVIVTFPPLRPPPTIISGVVYLDQNGDGAFNQDEPRVPEREILLQSGACGENGPTLTSVLSSPDGTYTLIGDFNGALCLQLRTAGELEGETNLEVSPGQALEGVNIPAQDN